jgi:mismatch-specific thymine-DNA glycosylase
MTTFKTKITVDGIVHETLADILPENGNLEILFIAKTPATVSVEAGHYFQGKQGTMFWNRLSNYDILKVPNGKFADEYLISNKYGITDIVKVPRDYGNEPTDEEYKQGLKRILLTIEKYKPTVIIFIYKKVLDIIIRLNFGISTKANYGFNPQFDKYFNSKVFVFPMPGTPCKSEEAVQSMNNLKTLLKK